MKDLKEYLRKNNDGEYILEVTNEREAQEPHAKHWIEVPKGCDYLISVFGVNSFIDSDMFAKFKTKNVLWSRKPMKEYLLKSGDGKYLITKHESNGTIEIPDGATYYAKDASLGKSGNFFFRLRSDDFDFEAVYLESNWIQAIFNVENQDVLWQRNNNQTIASAVESSHPEELPFIDDECYTNKSDGGFRLPKDEPCDMSKWVELRGESLNDQYAEIEKVRLSHREASEIADSALKHIRERAETYDQPTGERSAAKTAKAFNAITGKDITESEVWLLLQLLKDVRQWSREDYHQDSAEDCIAYASLKAESLEGGE